MQKQPATASVVQQAATCSNCALPELCLRAGLPPEDVAHLDRLVYARRKVERGDNLYRAGDPFSAIYAIRSGFFKNELVLQDGRSQIMGFNMAGEVMGMDGIGTGTYTCNAVALEDAEVCSVPLSRIEEFSQEMHDVAHRLHQIMSEEIVRDQQVIALLANKSAEARLAAFLVDISRRLAARGYEASDFELPMTRGEIGSLLGITIETVSRMFTKFHNAKLIDVQKRHIRILDAAGLEHLL